MRTQRWKQYQEAAIFLGPLNYQSLTGEWAGPAPPQNAGPSKGYTPGLRVKQKSTHLSHPAPGKFKESCVRADKSTGKGS